MVRGDYCKGVKWEVCIKIKDDIGYIFLFENYG